MHEQQDSKELDDAIKHISSLIERRRQSLETLIKQRDDLNDTLTRKRGELDAASKAAQ